MAKFIFRLENILQIKYKIEEQCKVEFGIAMEQLYLAIEKLEQMYARQSMYEQQLTELVSKGTRAIDIKEVSDSIEVIKISIISCKAEVAKREQAVELAREKLNNAMQERKTFEKLKENEFEKFKQEVNAQEMKDVDELVSYKFSPVNSHDNNPN